MVFFEAISVIVTLLVGLITFFKWRFGYWKRRNLPYLEGTIPFGTLQSPLQKNRVPVGVEIHNIYKKGKSNGWRHFGLFFGHKPAYFITDLDYIKNILSKDFNYFTDRGNFQNEKVEPLNANLFVLGGNKWRNLRRKLTPTFTSAKMRNMFQTIADCGLILDKVMNQLVEAKQPLNIKETLGDFTTDVIGSCAFGLECNSFEAKDSPFKKFAKRTFQSTTVGSLKRVLANSAPWLARLLNLRLLSPETSEFYLKVVRDTVRHRETEKIVRQDFLQLLLELKSDSDVYTGDGNTLTLNEIAAQCFVFFVAGFETSATTMTFALYELARNQPLQDRARNEIDKVLELHNGNINYDAMNDMKFMGQVINETLRMYPPVPFVTRECVQDYKVPDADLVIEKGTRVFIPIKGIQLDEDNFKQADKFIPDRFSDENKKEIKSYSFLAFGEGNRVCIGERFGIMQTKVGLTVLLRKYRFFVNKKTQEPIQMSRNSFTTAAQGDIWLDVEKIQ